MKNTPIKNDGYVFILTKRLKKAGIPFISLSFEKREGKQFAMFNADSWAVKKAMHPFDGCNPDFCIWNSKIRGTATIAFKMN